jgi:hypothetical protein
VGAELKVTISNALGSCWSTLTLKESSGPLFETGRKFDLWCYDENVTDISKYLKAYGYPQAVVPCLGPVETKFVADWITAYDCVPGIQDTAKIIYREFEAFDKLGRRSSVVDTIIVYRLPKFHSESFFCPGNLIVNCGDTSDFLSPAAIFNNGTLSGFLEFIRMTNLDGDLQFYPVELDPKCGLQVHVDYWKFGNSGCQQEYKVAVELKQSCPGSLSKRWPP